MSIRAPIGYLPAQASPHSRDFSSPILITVSWLSWGSVSVNQSQILQVRQYIFRIKSSFSSSSYYSRYRLKMMACSHVTIHDSWCWVPETLSAALNNIYSSLCVVSMCLQVWDLNIYLIFLSSDMLLRQPYWFISSLHIICRSRTHSPSQLHYCCRTLPSTRAWLLIYNPLLTSEPNIFRSLNSWLIHAYRSSNQILSPLPNRERIMTI